MGQKINPHGFRVGVIRDWNSRWYSDKKDFASLLVEDEKIRDFIEKKLVSTNAGISKIEIERAATKITVGLFTGKPGIVIGKGGAGVEELKETLAKHIGKPININVIEVRNPDSDAQLISESIAQQLERRVSYRRAMKMAMQRAMRTGSKGVKVKCSGRLGGAEIARVEGYNEGSIPLQTLRADITYGFSEAMTTYGKIGVKVWIYKGEILTKGIVPAAEATAEAARERKMGDNPRSRDNKKRPSRSREGGNR